MGKAKASDVATAWSTRLAAVICVGTVTVLLTWRALFADMIVNWDSALYLQCAELLLRGNMPYVDYVELNPPMAQYVHVPPVALAQLLDIGVPDTFHVIVLALTFGSAAALYYVTAYSRAVRSQAGRLLIAAIWIGFTFFVVARNEFGQREHLFMLSYVPFLYCREARHRGVMLSSWLTVPVGFFAGVLLMLKPHFLAIAMVVETGMLYRTRRWKTLLSTEVYFVFGIGLAYAVSLVVIGPLRDAFFGRWLPFIAENYDVYSDPLREVILKPPLHGMMFWVGVLIALVMATGALRCDVEEGSVLQLEALALALLGGIGAYVIQHKAWGYHLFPAAGFLMLLLGTSLVLLMESREGPSEYFGTGGLRSKVSHLTSLLVILAGFAVLVVSQGRKSMETAKYWHQRFDPYIEYISTYSSENARIDFIDTNLLPASPSVLIADRLPAGRHLTDFSIAMFYKEALYSQKRGEGPRGPFPYRGPQELTEKEQRFLKELGSDILGFKPQLVFIQSVFSCRACPAGFDVHGYLRHAGWMKKYLQHYEPADVVGRHVVYQRVDEDQKQTEDQ